MSLEHLALSVLSWQGCVILITEMAKCMYIFAPYSRPSLRWDQDELVIIGAPSLLAVAVRWTMASCVGREYSFESFSPKPCHLENVSVHVIIYLER